MSRARTNTRAVPPPGVPSAVIESERVTLEPQTAAHAEEMFAVLVDPAIYQHENQPPPSVEWLRERFARLESRRSSDGRERWLNWVVRLRTGEAIGYVQATVTPEGEALIAYVFGSAHWGHGLAREAVEAMIGELVRSHGVSDLSAVFKRTNRRSERLLERLGFVPDPYAWRDAEPDEARMLRKAVPR